MSAQRFEDSRSGTLSNIHTDTQTNHPPSQTSIHYFLSQIGNHLHTNREREKIPTYSHPSISSVDWFQVPL